MTDEVRAFGLPQPFGDHAPVTLAALLPLVEWTYGGEKATFKLKEWRPGQDKDGPMVGLVVWVQTLDSRHEAARETGRMSGGHYNVERSDAEALLVCKPEYPTLEEALDCFRRVCRLLALHEVDETLRFAGLLPFDPHTKEREREWPGTEATP